MNRITRKERFRKLRIKKKVRNRLFLVVCLLSCTLFQIVSDAKMIADNVAPSAGFELQKMKKLDLVIVTDFEDTALTHKGSELQSKIAAWQAEMYGNNVNIQCHYVASKKVFGKQSKTVTNYKYVRRAWISYVDAGRMESNTNGVDYNTAWSNRYNLIYFGTLEEKWSDIVNGYTPTGSEGITTPLTWNFTTQSADYSHSSGKGNGTAYICQNPNTGTKYQTSLYTYEEVQGFGCCSRTWNTFNNISYGNETSWVNSGTTKNDTYYFDIKGVSFDYLDTIVFRPDSEKVMVIISDNDSLDYTYTNKLNNGYSFMGLNNTVRDFIIDNKIAVYTVVPSSILDIKFNSNNNNSNISSQAYTLRELVNLSPTRGKILDSSWLNSLKYICLTDSINPDYLKISNNVLTLGLSNVYPDMRLYYFPNNVVLSDTYGNKIDNISGEQITSMSSVNLINGAFCSDAIEPSNNGYTRINLGSPLSSGNTFKYKNYSSDRSSTPKVGDVVGDWLTVTNNQLIPANNGDYICVAEVNSLNKVVRYSMCQAEVIED